MKPAPPVITSKLDSKPPFPIIASLTDRRRSHAGKLGGLYVERPIRFELAVNLATAGHSTRQFPAFLEARMGFIQS
jgi:hypothetical protein